MSARPSAASQEGFTQRRSDAEGERRTGERQQRGLSVLAVFFSPLAFVPSLPSAPASLREIESSLLSELAVSSSTMLVKKTRSCGFVVQRTPQIPRGKESVLTRSHKDTKKSHLLAFVPLYLCASVPFYLCTFPSPCERLFGLRRAPGPAIDVTFF